jgi:hypothetical protein
MLVKLLAFTSAYFCESSLFNGLQAMELRKPLSHPGSRIRLWANVSNSYTFPSSRASFGKRELDSVKETMFHTFLIFVKQNSDSYSACCGLGRERDLRRQKRRPGPACPAIHAFRRRERPQGDGEVTKGCF